MAITYRTSRIKFWRRQDFRNTTYGGVLVGDVKVVLVLQCEADSRVFVCEEM